MPRVSRHQTTWVVILAVALALRLGAGVWWQSRLKPDQPFYFGDSVGYWELARTIARGEPYAYPTADYQVFRTPGYPLLLSPLFLLTNDPPVIAARALSAVLGTLAVGLAGWWATRLFDAPAGRLAGWLTALYPGAISLGAFVLSEAPFCPLMLAHLAFWSQAGRATSQRTTLLWAIVAGVCAAAATLMRPSWLLFTPFALGIGLTFYTDRQRQLLIGATLCVTTIVMLLPWWIRNAQITGHFVPTTLQVGASLYDGLHPQATGASDMRFVSEVTARERIAYNESGSSDTFEYYLDRRMAAEAIEWAQANSGRAMELAAIKFLRIWNVWPNEPAFRSATVRAAMLLTYLPLLILGLVGVWRFTRCGWPFALAWLPAVYLTFLHVIFVGSIRYREPAMLALMVLAAGVLSSASRLYFGEERPATDRLSVAR